MPFNVRAGLVDQPFGGNRLEVLARLARRTAPKLEVQRAAGSAFEQRVKARDPACPATNQAAGARDRSREPTMLSLTASRELLPTPNRFY